MDLKAHFPVQTTEGFPVKTYLDDEPFVPIEANENYIVDRISHVAICDCPAENEECECSEFEEETSDEKFSEIYEKGFPFFKLDKKATTPKLSYMKYFSIDDYCNFERSDIFVKINENQWGFEANDICFELLCDAYEYGKNRNFTNRQGLALLEMFYSMFRFFMISPIISKKQFYRYFRELLLLYAVNDPPKSLRFYTPMECFDIAHKFSILFDRNFDLLRSIVYPNFIIKINIEE